MLNFYILGLPAAVVARLARAKRFKKQHCPEAAENMYIHIHGNINNSIREAYKRHLHSIPLHKLNQARTYVYHRDPN